MAYSTETTVVIKAPRSAVWEALTDPKKVKQYFFNTDLITDWELGSPISFQGEWEGKKYEDKGKVLEFAPTESLSYSYWSPSSGIPDKPELYQVIRYTLTEAPDGIKVGVTQSNIDTKERAEHSAKNWKGALESLKKFVENEK